MAFLNTLTFPSPTPQEVSQAEIAFCDGLTENVQAAITAERSRVQSILLGGTGATTAGGALTNLGAAAEADVANLGPPGIELFGPGAKYKNIQILNAASGDITIGSPASGKKWLVLNIQTFNPTGGTLTMQGQFIHPSYAVRIPFHTALSPVTMSKGNIAGCDCPVLDSTMSLVANTTGAGLTLMAGVIEFPASSAVKAVFLTGIASGNNTHYACPAGKSALPFDVQSSIVKWAWLSPHYYQTTGGTRSIYGNLVVSGGSVIAPGIGSNSLHPTAISVAESTRQSTTNNGTTYCLIGEGDSLNLNSDSSHANQLAWVNLVEV